MEKTQTRPEHRHNTLHTIQPTTQNDAKNSSGERKSTTDKSATSGRQKLAPQPDHYALPSLRKNSAATSKQPPSTRTIPSNHPLRLLPFHYARLQRPQNQRRLEKNPVKNGNPRNAQTASFLARTSNPIPNNRPWHPNRQLSPKLQPLGRSPKHQSPLVKSPAFIQADWMMLSSNR